jgi:protein disulfide-isomerase A1
MIYSANDDERKTLAEALSVVAMKHRDDINFATVDAVKNAFSMEPLGLKVDQLPAFVIQTHSDVFKFNTGVPITPEAIEDFIQETLYSKSTHVVYQTAHNY